MYLYWWNIVILAFVVVYLLIKVDQLYRKTKELRSIIAKLEGEKNYELGTTGDAEGEA